MNWSDYEALWKRQVLPAGAAADLAKLKAEFSDRTRKQAATLATRDWLEAGAGMVVASVLGVIWRKLGATGWPVGIAILLILGVIAVFFRERFRASRRRLAPGAPLLEQVSADLAVLRRQQWMAHWIWVWYLGPLLAALLLVHAALCLNAQPWEPQRDPVFSAFFVGFYVVAVLAAWAMNRRAVRRQLEPRIAELEKLHAALATGD